MAGPVGGGRWLKKHSRDRQAKWLHPQGVSQFFFAEGKRNGYTSGGGWGAVPKNVLAQCKKKWLDPWGGHSNILTHGIPALGMSQK